MNKPNFLIGRGELLVRDIKGPKRFGDKAEVYPYSYAIQRLRPKLKDASQTLDSLPDDACPRDFGVALLTLNPGYIARSYFPVALLRAAGLESVGSRTVKVTPEAWTKKGEPAESSTTQLFVAGKRSVFRSLPDWIQHAEQGSDEALDIAHIEEFQAFSPDARVRDYGSLKERFFEVGLHLLQEDSSAFIQQGFAKFAAKLDVKLYGDLAFRAGNLWFIPAEGSRQSVERLALFSFVRVIRPMPKLRGMRPITRTSSVSITCQLPTTQPLSSEPRVAILDGGLPSQHPISPWVKAYHRLDPNAADDLEANEHGLGVTSAFLFGPLQPNGMADRPYSYVDSIRVLDDDSHTEDRLEMYRTLGFVEQVLLSRQYEFINLSLGPDLPIEDSDVHAWTAVIDDLLGDGDTFMTISVGNNGENDRVSGNARIQVPADCVNGIAVGAADSTTAKWARAAYSAVGPGRSPGVMKPDLLAFGGDSSHYFHVLTPSNRARLAPQMGTSLAGPYLLRSAVGMRAILGTELSPLTLKALMIHGADAGEHDKCEVGWGKIPEDLMTLITCPDGVARIIYQGELKPGKYLRAALPLPQGGLTGNIVLGATFCYACPTDPQDASAYTRAGLDVVFRPNSAKVKDGASNASSKGFFDMKQFATEEERRSDLGKWETVLHGEKSMRGSSLSDPVFDIHYNAREGGGKASNAEKIRYALVITIKAPKHADLYNDILRTYVSILTPLQSQVSLPIRV
ncbi:S8 family peptidase [Janthinobacterium sp.]|uniref:S8 family peptidase n=1 Tax=Janthinobacterium sp. TaxID=1871054 RepID=UPI0025BA39B1|nr:S8 family peptidase [Janthinobacterium sp.]NBV16494.1 peptidase S8 and S53, subtilisin, kexin, sedolisin [Janthinobacterium sp.]